MNLYHVLPWRSYCHGQKRYRIEVSVSCLLNIYHRQDTATRLLRQSQLLLIPIIPHCRYAFPTPSELVVLGETSVPSIPVYDISDIPDVLTVSWSGHG